MLNPEYSCQKEVDSICACVGIKNESFDFFLGKRLTHPQMNENTWIERGGETHPSCLKRALMNSSLERIKLSVQRGRHAPELAAVDYKRFKPHDFTTNISIAYGVSKYESEEPSRYPHTLL